MCHLDPYDAIKLHKSRVLSLGTQEILINRQCGIMLRDLFKKFKRGDLDIKKVPDVTFIGEEGIDAEGSIFDGVCVGQVCYNVRFVKDECYQVY